MIKLSDIKDKMRYLYYFRVLIIVCFARVNCEYRNQFEPYIPDKEWSLSENNTGTSTPSYDLHEVIRRTFQQVPAKTLRVPFTSKYQLSDTEVSVDDYGIRRYSPYYEVDSTELNSNSSTSKPTEYMEEFTTKSESLLTQTATWQYQNNRSSEESDESKSTLIDYPFSVSIQRKGSHYTSGALLDKWWIVTAAGEFYHIRDTLKLFRARLGTVDCKKGGSLVPIKKIEIHPYYVPGKPNFDVALLRMAFFIDFSHYIRPIAISNMKGKVISAKFMSTYWPRIMVNGKALPNTASERISYNSMRVSMQRLIPRRKCAKTFKNIDIILNESSLCLKPVLSHHSKCMPDIGAPIVAEDGLWGITSGWVPPTCPKKATPTIFTRLSSPSVRSWLNTFLYNI